MWPRRSQTLYAEPRDPRFEDCAFYHKMEIPGQGEVGGYWDLRGQEDTYLGSVALDGRRTLEIGPGNGFLTFFMESRGAEVVAVELAPGMPWDVVPHAGLDVELVQRERRGHLEQLRNGFWYAHKRHESSARVHYGSVYELPPELGRFDVGTLCSVLLHLRDPLGAVIQVAQRADTVVVAEPYFADLPPSLARLETFPGSSNWDTWWRLGPDLFKQFFAVLGFEQLTASFHQQAFFDGETVHPIPYFTLVASRAPSP